MNHLEASRLHAAETLHQLFDAATPEHVEPPCLAVIATAVDAITEHTNALHDQQLVNRILANQHQT